MKTNPMKTMMTAALALGLSLAMTDGLRADTFGSGANTFTIDFVTVGNAGNTNDAGAGGGNYSSSFGGVPYNFRIGTYEISQNAIDKATASGMTNVTAGPWSGSKSATQISWYEAAAFVNWLNTSTGHQAAYDLTYNSGNWTMNLWSSGNAWQLGGENLYRHKDAYYYLPSENEWYKAAFHKNDGVTANYWDYATGSNTAPTAVANGTASGTAVYGSQGSPAEVNNAGGLSPYGTMGQNGNVWDWIESAFDQSNNSTTEYRAVRGGLFYSAEADLRSSARGGNLPDYVNNAFGFRVASVPEPSASLLMLMAGGAWLLKRRRRFSL